MKRFCPQGLHTLPVKRKAQEYKTWLVKKWVCASYACENVLNAWKNVLDAWQNVSFECQNIKGVC